MAEFAFFRAYRARRPFPARSAIRSAVFSPPSLHTGSHTEPRPATSRVRRPQVLKTSSSRASRKPHVCAKGSSPRIAAMSSCGCAAVGSWSCFGCVTRSFTRALRRMLASGEAIFSLASAAGCARFYSLVVAARSTMVYTQLLRWRISTARL